MSNTSEPRLLQKSKVHQNLLLKSFQNSDFPSYLLLSLILSIINFNFFRLDVEPHHDGIIFAQAVGVAEGLIPNRDLFAYYGPGSAWIHGFVLMLFGDKLIVLRFFTMFLILITSVCLFHLLKKFIGQFLALGITLCWGITPGTNFPWPSEISTSLVILAMVVLGSERFAGNEEKRTYIASLILVLATYVRIHVVIISILVIAVMLTIKSNRNLAKIWILAHIICHTIIWILMFCVGSSTGFIRDSINYPRSVALGGHFSISYFVGLMFYPAFFILLSTLYKFFCFKVQTARLEVIYRLLLLLVSFSLASFVIYFYNQPRNPPQTYRNPQIIAVDLSNMFPAALCYWSAFYLIILSVGYVRNHLIKAPIENSNTKALRTPLVFLAISLGSLAQLYPLYDKFHLWFISPIVFVGVAALLEGRVANLIIHRMAIAAVISLLISTQLVLCIVNANKVRVEYKSPILAGMYGIPSHVLRIDKTLEFVSKFSSANEIRIDCSNGLYSVANGSFLSNTPAFVNWGPKYDRPASRNSDIFLCHATFSQISKYLDQGWVIKHSEKYLDLNLNLDRYNVLLVKL